MSGIFVAVVGASGVGKDSLIGFARERLVDDVSVVRRVVTRPPDGDSEDHVSLTPDAFAAADQAGHFALSWQAHGLQYGLPITLEADLAAGRLVIANLSRAALPRLLARYPTALVVEVTAVPEIIAQRLTSRGREAEEEIRRRMNRSVDHPLPPSSIRIDNSGDLAVAGTRFTALLRDLLRQSA
ncbi:phosphonate metabolism protein/1,5-bisphosphokinase (PRPP-forming) PhnN [uncultured Devosia sp.]|uniref:phosphonate metabolism protein/1,5-bisphosphokinase (PRPP-forming) PhnN n=1 Tax=uncultured Devosia sp. TaxID=211434 RepID=UPI00262CBD31|nr:phosphonate metabolism protein/1,5-bisphosphokinase (PRPP-forming) PhnN [uncultured Devosia sp.]